MYCASTLQTLATSGRHRINVKYCFFLSFALRLFSLAISRGVCANHFLARDAFVGTNRGVIAMMFVRLSGTACIGIIRCTLERI